MFTLIRRGLLGMSSSAEGTRGEEKKKKVRGLRGGCVRLGEV